MSDVATRTREDTGPLSLDITDTKTWERVWGTRRSVMQRETQGTAVPQVIRLPNATISQNISEELEQEFTTLFAFAREEIFEDGMESEFSRRLVSLVRVNGEEALQLLTDLIIGERVNAEVAAEALIWLDEINDPLTYLSRLRLLQQGLFVSSARVRDGAIVGLASLDDPRAITSIKWAIGREQIDELRKNMQQVLEQLESMR